MKAYRDIGYKIRDSLPITEKMARGIFSLPLYPKLKTKELLKISKALNKVLIKI